MTAPATALAIERLGGTPDAARIAAIHAIAFRRPWESDAFAALLAEHTVVGHGLRLGPELAGFALSRLVLDEADLLTIALAPAARGRGLGQGLLAAHLADLVESGARAVHLEVAEANAMALALYARLGFREVGRRPAYYREETGPPSAGRRLSLVIRHEGGPGPAAGMDRLGPAGL